MNWKIIKNFSINLLHQIAKGTENWMIFSDFLKFLGKFSHSPYKFFSKNFFLGSSFFLITENFFIRMLLPCILYMIFACNFLMSHFKFSNFWQFVLEKAFFMFQQIHIYLYLQLHSLTWVIAIVYFCSEQIENFYISIDALFVKIPSLVW